MFTYLLAKFPNGRNYKDFNKDPTYYVEDHEIYFHYMYFQESSSRIQPTSNDQIVSPTDTHMGQIPATIFKNTHKGKSCNHICNHELTISNGKCGSIYTMRAKKAFLQGCPLGEQTNCIVYPTGNWVEQEPT